MKFNKIVAGILACSIVAGSTFTGLSVITYADTTGAEISNIETNDESLWITEIYNNDVDRRTVSV